MTDKATVTILSPKRGKVLQIVGKEGDTAKVHGTLVVLEVEGGPATAQAAPSLPAQQAGQPAPLQTKGAPQPSASGNGEERRGAGTPGERGGGGGGGVAP